MKTFPRIFPRILLAAVILAMGQGITHADAGYSFSFTLDQKKEGGTTQMNEEETVKNQKWSYMVTMENKSFKDVGAMEIKYVVFSKQEQAGRVSRVGSRPQSLQRHEGSTTVPGIKNNDKVTFNTDPVVLKTVELNDGWYYATGADTRSKGALRGIWLRVFVGGIMVAEYMDPPNLSDNTTFDPPVNNNN